MKSAALLGPAQLIVRSVRFTLAWSPVWIPAILIWQFSTRGLEPSQAERTRLDAAAPQVLERYEKQRANFEVMAAEAEAWTDPVFRERRRRLRASAREASMPLPTDGPHPEGDQAGEQGR